MSATSTLTGQNADEKKLALFREALMAGDPSEIESAFDTLVVARPNDGGFWSRMWMLIQLRAAQCRNYAGIIRVADSIINDPNSSTSEKQWAQGKKDAAVKGQQENGCVVNVS